MTNWHTCSDCDVMWSSAKIGPASLCWNCGQAGSPSMAGPDLRGAAYFVAETAAIEEAS